MNAELPNPTILVIDDNATNLGVLTGYLHEQGFQIMIARNGRAGVEKACIGQPDLILLDVMMPDMDGFEVCRCLKANSDTKDIPVIFITALNSVEDKVHGFAAGGLDYLTKPLQAEEVLARVQTHLQIQAQKRQLQQQALELKQAKDLAEAAQKNAEQANHAKSVFLANMSHELRSPLNAILGFAQVMAHSRTLPPEHQEHAQIINRSGEHLLTLINQVLDLSKIEAGQISLHETEVNLTALLDDLENLFRLRAQEKGLRLQVDCAPDVPCCVRTDVVKLRQVLLNLLNNAIKFTRVGGVTIRIENCPLKMEDCPATLRQAQDIASLRATGQSSIVNLRFSIADTGPGIAPEELRTLFEAFTQTTAGKQSQEGTGLGLAISRKFVQLMGGNIVVNSEVGSGTTFTFAIPVSVAANAAMPAKSPERRSIGLEPGQPPYRLLIVDDRQDNRRLMRDLLAPLGFDLREAENGAEALTIWDAWQPHLIWMDIRMPVLDGYDATKRIRAAEAQRGAPQTRTPIIALTAVVFEEERAEVLAAGCDDLLRKPFREAELFELLTKHLGVRYVYETGAGQTMERALTPTALSNLPADLLTELKQAAIQGDMEMIEKLIAQMRSYDAPVADALAALAKEFEYGTILQLL